MNDQFAHERGDGGRYARAIADALTLAYPGLALVVAAQAVGVPVPAESALIACAVIASRGSLDIVAVAGAASAGAVAGGFCGYAVGRYGARRLALLFARLPRFATLLAAGERFFGRHGARAVFLARWASGMRMVAAPLAGVHAMSWRTFALWNVAGGMLWPASIAAVAYVLGRRVAVLIGVATLLAIVAVITSRRRRARRAPGP